MFGQVEKRSLSPVEKRFFYLGVFTVALLVGSILSGSALARTWYIKADGTGDAPTIQAAVDSAAGRDTVLVGGGTYTDTTHVMVAGTLRAVNVYIQKQITLLGDPVGDRPLIDQVDSYFGIFVENVDSTVSIGHLSMRWIAFPMFTKPERIALRTETRRDYPAGVRCQSSSLDVFDVELSHQDDGICLLNSTAHIGGNEIHTVTVGVACLEGSNASVHDNRIYNCAIGVDCEGSIVQILNNTIGAPEPAGQGSGISCSLSTVHIEGNTVKWCGNGVSAISSDVTIEGNTVGIHDYGASLYNTTAVISNNTFRRGWYAVWASSGSTGEISNNTMDDYTSAAIFSELGASQAIRRNIMTRVNWGVVCLGATATIECNDVFDVGSGPYDGCEGLPENGNFSADPEYCGVDDSGNYFLQTDSPCAPGNHPVGLACGLIGALPVNCGKVWVQQSTWGSIKGKFKDGGIR